MALQKGRRRATHRPLLWTMGFCLLGVAPASAAPRAYISNPYSDTLSVIDTGTDTVIATIEVSNAPGAVAVHPGGREVYVTTEVDGTVSVIDTFSNRVTATIPIELASSLAVSPLGDRLYATNYFTGLVSVFDTATRQLLTEVGAGEGLVDIAVAADGSHIFVTNQYSSQERRPCTVGPIMLYCDIPVAVIDTTNDTGPLIPIGDFLDGVAADPRGGRFYVADVWPLGPGYTNFQAVLTIVAQNPTSGLYDVVKRVPLGSFFEPVAVASLPDGSRAYASGGGMLSVIDAVSDTLIEQLPVSAGALSATPDGKSIYAVGDDTVSVLDTASDTIVATIVLKTGLYAMGQFIGPDIEFPTPTPVPLGPCTGDCDGDGKVSTAELVSCVDIALGTMPIVRCRACAADAGDSVMINDVVRAVDAAVRGCVAE